MPSVWSQGRIVETFFQDQKVVPTAKLYSKVCRWLGPGSSIYIASQLQILKFTGHCYCTQLWLCVMPAFWGHPSVKWSWKLISSTDSYTRVCAKLSYNIYIYWDSRISVVDDWFVSSTFNKWRLMLSQCKVLIFSAAVLCICIQRTASDIIFSVSFFLPRCRFCFWMFLLSVVVHIHDRFVTNEISHTTKYSHLFRQYWTLATFVFAILRHKVRQASLFPPTAYSLVPTF